jgi:hypothetical protein
MLENCIFHISPMYEFSHSQAGSNEMFRYASNSDRICASRADFVAEVADERRQLRATFEPRLWLPLAPLEAAALKRLR